MYMRVLDVYNEYLYHKQTYENKVVHQLKVKVFDTVAVRKIIQDRKNGGLDQEIDNELEDFYENDIFILPVMNSEDNRCCLVVIQILDDTMRVELFDTKRTEFTDDEIEEMN